MINCLELEPYQRIYKDMGDLEQSEKWNEVYSYYFVAVRIGTSPARKTVYIIRVDSSGAEDHKLEIVDFFNGRDPILEDYSISPIRRDPNSYCPPRYKFFDGRKSKYWRNANRMVVKVKDLESDVKKTGEVMQVVGGHASEQTLFALAYYKALALICEERISELDKKRREGVPPRKIGVPKEKQEETNNNE